MSTPSSDFLRILTERGYIHQCSDMGGLDALANKGEIIAYVGYDCTAASLHVGHLLSIMMMHWLQASGGGKPIALMGGGTTRVGDPSGRDETRRILPVETINANKDAIKGVFSRFLTFGEGRRDAIMPMATCIAVGKVSFEDCPIFTWSFGWTGFFDPITPPSISIARFEMTSFAFMFDCVPDPVCQTTRGKLSSNRPSITSCAAAAMALPSSGEMSP